jgi:nucleoside-diphosphate-sugar epimerase
MTDHQEAPMRVAVTGGTGFVGGHLAARLCQQGHQVVLVARGVDQRPWARQVLRLPRTTLVPVGIGDAEGLARAFAGCQAVAHCAGINRQIGRQTYQAVHVRGTANVVAAAERAGVRRLALLSFLRARPDCGWAYHESKWAAEELVRASSLEWTVLKPGMIYGRGDHMLDHLSHALHTFPVFVRLGSGRVRPLAVQDVVRVLDAALIDGRLPRKTVALLGPTELALQDAVGLVARVLGKHPPLVRLPTGPLLYLLAWLTERVMTIPALSIAQARILTEQVVEPTLAPDHMPADLVPSTPYDEHSIRAGLPDPAPFGLADLRCSRRWQHGMG